MKRLQIAFCGLCLMASALACNLDVNVPSNPKPPIPSLVASTGDADAFEQGFSQAVALASSTGQFNVAVTQEQFSSWLALRAPTYAQQQGYDWPLKDVQAGLSDGKVMLYGIITQQGTPDTPAQIIFTPSIDANGELAVSIDSGQLGIVGVPQSLLNSLVNTVKNMLAAQLAQIKGKYKLTGLSIANGTLNVSGQIVSS
jgi:hypothetical protein